MCSKHWEPQSRMSGVARQVNHVQPTWKHGPHIKPPPNGLLRPLPGILLWTQLRVLLPGLAMPLKPSRVTGAL